jgi:TetR/AcrR family transcriptional repressor of nem operon
MNKAAVTRLGILQKAFELIYENGYQTTSVDDIIAKTKVTKGAFYYHFETKDEMALAIIREILTPSPIDGFAETFKNAKDPNKEIYSMIKYLLFENPMLLAKYGCPIGNLTQELAPWHKEVSKALNLLTLRWRTILSSTIKSGIQSGYYRSNVNPDAVCDFIISGYWGIRNLGKLDNSTKCYNTYLKEFKNYLNSLR